MAKTELTEQDEIFLQRATYEMKKSVASLMQDAESRRHQLMIASACASCSADVLGFLNENDNAAIAKHFYAWADHYATKAGEKKDG